MTAAGPASAKLGRLSGTLSELGQFQQRGGEFQYASLTVAGADGGAQTLARVAIPAELNGLLEIGAPVDLFFAKRGVWHFCYGVHAGGKLAQSYRGYRFFFIFNRLLMYVNLVFGAYLLSSPKLLWAGAGFLAFGVLFAFLGPASPRRMNAFFAAGLRTASGKDLSRSESGEG